VTLDPVRWPTAERENELKAYLHYEITQALSARRPLERQWRQWLEQYRAPAKQAVKDFPYLGASNVVLPITATDADQFYAKFMQSIHASPDLWIVQAMNERWVDAAKPLQDFLSALDRSVLKMYRVNKRAIMEMVKLGTAIYEHGWIYEQRPIKTYDPSGQIIRANRIRSQPFVDHVRLVDFLIPPYAYAIQPDDQGGAPWVAKRVEMTREQMLAYAKSTEPWLPNIGMKAALEILAYENTQQDLYDDTVQRLTYEPRARERDDASFDRSSDATDGQSIGGLGNYVNKIKLWEVHVRWAVDGDSPSDLVILFHEPTQTILRAIYQPYLHGQRPFEAIRFFPTEGFYGIGICEQTEVFQKMSSDLQNYLIDNVLLGNATMLAAKQGANIAPGEPIYPGKVLITEGNPREEIVDLRLGAGAYPGLNNIIGLIDQQHNRRSGLSDLQVGNIDGLPGRTPATAVQALLAEGNRRPDLTIKDMRYEGLSTIGLRLIQLCQQFIGSPMDLDGQRYLAMAVQTLGEPEGYYAAEKLRTPLENAELGLGVEIAAASAQANKDLQRQQLTGLLTLYGQMAPQMIQMAQTAQQAQGTPIGAIATKTLGGMSELLGRVLEQYDFRDAEQFVPDVPLLMAQAQAAPAPGGQPPVGAPAGPGQGDFGLGAGPPMGGVPGGAGGVVPQ